MPNNRIYIYEGEQGLNCQCGNSEATPETGSYKTFSVWWDTVSPPAGVMAVCSKCGSGAIKAQVIRRPAQPAE